MRTLSIIGAGRVGKTLGRVLFGSGAFRIGEIHNRTLESALRAAQFIGSGKPLRELSRLEAADLLLIAVPDDRLVEIAHRIAECKPRPGTIVFHTSGAHPSSALREAAEIGCSIASVHPVKSFADPERASATFEGTWCAVEGDPGAVGFLTEIFRAAGGRTLTIDPAQKPLYHSAFAFSCAYLAALLDAATRAGSAAGIPPNDVAQLVVSLARDTLENVASLGPGRALTGPIARGDAAVIGDHLTALRRLDPELEMVYRQLGSLTSRIAEREGFTDPDTQSKIRRQLGGE